jgi:hypothetical protein
MMAWAVFLCSIPTPTHLEFEKSGPFRAAGGFWIQAIIFGKKPVKYSP